jgi:hypothetical protein
MMKKMHKKENGVIQITTINLKFQEKFPFIWIQVRIRVTLRLTVSQSVLVSSPLRDSWPDFSPIY